MMSKNNKNDKDKLINIIPLKQRIQLRNRKIKELNKIGYSIEEICKMVGLSKTTVFFAIQGRLPKKEGQDRRYKKNRINNN